MAQIAAQQALAIHIVTEAATAVALAVVQQANPLEKDNVSTIID